jgi:RNA polymerase subunit RPABC4/transcription elongation factor Spt4/RsiW-degrading membrane proteinase PrsW (M82 family)
MSKRRGKAPPELVLETCPHCGELVPVGAFCGNCGAQLADTAGGARLHSYAAAPDEHVVRPTVISTLFPHLPHRHAHIFREVLGAGLLIVVLLAALRLYTSALIGAALLLPILYLIYLYEVDVYETEPVLVVGATFVIGAVLGVGYALVTGHFISGTIGGTQQGPFVSGVVLPLIAELLMVVGPLLLLSHSQFDESLDGLTFGVTAALGFTVAAVLTGFWHTFTAPLQGNTGVSAGELLRLLREGILLQLVNATTTGAITAALWLRTHGRSRRRHVMQWREIGPTVGVAFAAQIVLGLVTYYVTSLLLQVMLWAIAAAALLIWLRVILHHALLEEGSTVAMIGDVAACSECHRLVPTMLFCPACGVARSAASKHRAAPVVPETGEVTS